jgi:Flp pilus assembly protein CpaB
VSQNGGERFVQQIQQDRGVPVTAATHGLEAPRSIIHRRSLPSGRAVTGGFLVALAALGVFVASRGAGEHRSRSFVVVARDVTAGTTLSPSDLTVSAIDLPDQVAARSFTEPAAVVGQIAVAPLTAGELVESSNLVGGDATDSRVELSLPIERSRAVDGLLQPGEKVDVLATYADGGPGETVVVTRDAEVRRVDSGSHTALGATDDTILVLAIADPDEALAVAHASQAGKVTVIRSTGVHASGSASYQPPQTDSH